MGMVNPSYSEETPSETLTVGNFDVYPLDPSCGHSHGVIRINNNNPKAKTLFKGTLDECIAWAKGRK